MQKLRIYKNASELPAAMRTKREFAFFNPNQRTRRNAGKTSPTL